MHAPPWYVVGADDFRFKIAPSRVHGLGLFAKLDLARGAAVCSLTGQRMQIADIQRLRASLDVPKTLKDYFFMEWNHVGETVVIARPFRTVYSYINHSRQPNCRILGRPGSQHWRVELIEPAPEGAELLLDYREEHLPREYLVGHGSTYL